MKNNFYMGLNEKRGMDKEFQIYIFLGIASLYPDVTDILGKQNCHK